MESDGSAFCPSGAQWEIRSAGHRAVLTEVGGGVRVYEVDGRPVLDGYDAGEVTPSGAGAVLVPWPNRIRDGRYIFGGIEHQLALTEPGRRNASHGLLRWVPWSVVDRRDDAVTLAVTLHPQPGYPHALIVQTRWSVGREGLRADHRATNVGNRPAPFGLGAHPYLMVAGVPPASWSLHLPAAQRLLTDERALPTGRERVAGTRYDFRSPRPLAGLALDTAYTDLVRVDGVATVTIAGPGDERVAVWMDAAFGWVQVFTADAVGPPRTARSWAVEPMTCPPDAFNSAEDLIVLEPGATWTGSWGVRPTAPGPGSG